MEESVCIHCGEPESAHCHFEPAIIPKGCICDVMTWDDPKEIPAICSEFKGIFGDKSYCVKCEHDLACHKSIEVGKK